MAKTWTQPMYEVQRRTRTLPWDAVRQGVAQTPMQFRYEADAEQYAAVLASLGGIVRVVRVR